MNDRIPTFPGRVKLTDEETGVSKFYTFEMADQPIEAGTALNKANLLTDATAAAIAAFSAATPDTPNEALNHLATAISGLSDSAKIATGSYTGNGTYGTSNRTTITFPFIPKIVFIQNKTEQALGLPYLWGSSVLIAVSRTTTLTANNASISDATLSFYNTSSYEAQLNKTSIIYNWVAIG